MCIILCTPCLSIRFTDAVVISSSPCTPTSYWIRDLNLIPEYLQLLQETKQLNDRIITAVRRILKSQFQEVQTFQPTLHAQTLHKPRPAKEGSLFFYNFSNHWMVSRFSKGQVCQYDSLYSPGVLLWNYRSSLLPSTPTLQRAPSCESSSYKFRFREAAMTVSVLQLLLLFLFFKEMTQLPLFTTRKTCMRQHFIECLH